MCSPMEKHSSAPKNILVCFKVPCLPADFGDLPTNGLEPVRKQDERYFSCCSNWPVMASHSDSDSTEFRITSCWSLIE